MTRDAAARMVRRIAKAAGIAKRIGPHSLRHFFITAALDAGGHRGWKGDPLYDIRKLLVLGAKSVNDTGWTRLRAAFAAGDPTDALSGTWAGKEKVRDVYLTDDVAEATRRLDDAIIWEPPPRPGPSCGPWPGRCDGGGHRSSPTTPPAPPTAPSRQRT
ncbi:MAG: hypothetical protein M3P70_12740 [Actinomycetota bacterium]|nr:hypothetical protein [Actinomycetota bacterium]